MSKAPDRARRSPGGSPGRWRVVVSTGLAMALVLSLLPAVAGAQDEEDPLQRVIHELLPEVGQGDRLAHSVAAGGEGDDTVYGAGSPFDDGPRGFDTGSVLVYGVQRFSGGSVLTDPRKLAPDDLDADSLFGTALGFSADGNMLGVGAPGAGGGAGAVHVFDRVQGSEFGLVAGLIADNGVTGDGFGSSLAVSGDLVGVGVPGADGGAGRVDVFVRQGPTFVLLDSIAAANRAAGDGFGSSVAMSEGLIAVGVPGADGGAGRVDVFVRDGSTFVLLESIVANDRAGGDRFGSSVAIAGNVIHAGAPFAGGTGSGFAFRYDPTTGGITLEATLAPDGLSQGAGFGTSVAALHAFGTDVALYGAPADGQFGSAYRFEFRDGAWTLVGVLSPPQHLEPSPGAGYGTSVGLNFFDIQVVGAPRGGQLPDAGEFYVNRGLSEFSYRRYDASDLLSTNVASDFASSSAALGDFFLMTEPSASLVRIYARDPVTGTWNERFQLAPSDGASQFGVAIDTYEGPGEGDDLVLVGAQGGGYLFRGDATVGDFTEVAKLLSDALSASGEVASSVTISDRIAALGFPSDSTSELFAGSVPVFGPDDTGSWRELTILRGDDQPRASFGSAMDIAGTSLIVGAPGEANGAGAAYNYRIDDLVGPSMAGAAAGPALLAGASAGAFHAPRLAMAALGPAPLSDGGGIERVEKLTNPDPAANGGFFGYLIAATVDQVAIATLGLVYTYLFASVAGELLGDAALRLGDIEGSGSLEAMSLVATGFGGALDQILLFLGSVAQLASDSLSNVSGLTRSGDGQYAPMPGWEGGLFPGGLPGLIVSLAALSTPDRTAVLVGLGTVLGFGGERATLVEFISLAGQVDPPVADLELTKTGSPAQVEPGGQITYTLTVKNHGPDTAFNVRLNEFLGEGLSFVSIGPVLDCRAIFDQGLSDIGCLFDEIPKDQQRTVTVVATVDDDRAGSDVTNAAFVISDTPEPDPGRVNSAGVTTPVTADTTQPPEPPVDPVADLELTKTDSPDPVLPGGEITYTLRVTNHGPATAVNVRLTDVLGDGLRSVSATFEAVFAEGGFRTCPSDPVIVCTLGDMDRGEQKSVTIVATVDDDRAGTTVTNTASVSSDTLEPAENLHANRASTDTRVLGADLELTKTASPARVEPGGQITYTLTVTNHGPDEARNVRLTDFLGGGLRFVSADPADDCSAFFEVEIHCRLGDIPEGGQRTVTIVASVSVHGDASTVTNRATVTSDTLEPDPDEHLNSASITTPVAVEADLELTKTATPGRVEPGGQITYTLTVTNHGPATARNVVVTDPLGASLQFAVAAPLDDCRFDGVSVVCEFEELAKGESEVVTIVVTEVRGATTSGYTVANSASVRSDTREPEAGPHRNSDSADTYVSPDTRAPRDQPEQPGESETPEDRSGERGVDQDGSGDGEWSTDDDRHVVTHQVSVPGDPSQPVTLTVPLQVGMATITLSGVTTGGQVSVTPCTEGAPAQRCQVPTTATQDRTWVGPVVDITPTDVDFETIRICLPFTQALLPGLPPAALRLFHLVGSGRDITTEVDSERRQVCGETDSTSPFAVGVDDVTRLAGPERDATAAAISARTFTPGVPVAYVATSRTFPDALAAGPAAAMQRGPVLLTDPVELSAVTAEELRRLRPKRIVVLGGAAAVSDAVVAQLDPLTEGPVDRLAGADRYGTAAAVSLAAFPEGSDVVYLATGEDFADALSGGAAAAAVGAPVLLVTPTGVPPVIAAELARLRPRRVVLLGGPAAISDAVARHLAVFTRAPVRRLAGDDRYGTAAAVARATFPSGVPAALVATGTAFPDSLAGVPAAGLLGAPLLLVAPDRVPSVVRAELGRLDPDRIILLGGEAAVSGGVERQLRDGPPQVPAAGGLIP